MSDIVERLRKEADEAERWDGPALNSWDKIRHQVETLKGSDLPRMNFESLIGGFTELMREAADEIDRLCDLLAYNGIDPDAIIEAAKGAASALERK